MRVIFLRRLLISNFTMFAYYSAFTRHERKITDSDKKLFAKIFRKCAGDNKEYLTREDLKVAVTMLFGYKPSKVETDTMMSPVLLCNSPGMTVDDFINAMSIKMAAQDRNEEIRQIFSAFDLHCRGFLNFEDFRKAFHCVAPHLPEQTIIEAFSHPDEKPVSNNIDLATIWKVIYK
ncbi:EF-hand calcium-binding domain-containing protein 11 isoform X2 [Protopterus annectens]|uniref:EF-hand calcium-binding domain-containing protein 11 isoform X2 n=1 Tax=Protopterus annectens TaxID=7888 RepID=UPI001CFA6BE6|nr:EF-hand calcium-binding domain-containing protein 11 isoform X2 [Protopterus annectens]